MYKKLYLLMAMLVIASLVLTACGGTATPEAPVTEEAPVATEEAPAATEEAPAATE
jgi:ABC-type glycerol-3-phosphate transport system substrate-binding protein